MDGWKKGGVVVSAGKGNEWAECEQTCGDNGVGRSDRVSFV